ncbi:hypothetical protein FQR65_LT15386 [Abscondita terminalis]|nr:hypothetical protein FQR65_LT15386 [Abscondita terminalis]
MRKDFRYVIDPLIKIMNLIGYYNLSEVRMFYFVLGGIISRLSVNNIIIELVKLYNAFMVVYSITTSFLYNKRVKFIITEIVNIDNAIKSLCKTRFDYKRSRARLIFGVVIWGIMHAAISVGTNVSVYLDRLPFSDLTPYRVYHIAVLYYASTNFFIMLTVSQLTLQLRKMKNVYDTSWKVANDVKNIFEIFFLCQIVMYTCFLIFALFWTTTSTFNGKRIVYFKYVGAAFIISAMSDVVLWIYFCTSFCEEYIAIKNKRLRVSKLIFGRPRTNSSLARGALSKTDRNIERALVLVRTERRFTKKMSTDDLNVRKSCVTMVPKASNKAGRTLGRMPRTQGSARQVFVTQRS